MNTKDKNYKKYLEVRRRKREILDAQRNLGYEKLDKPYQRGWDAYWVLRPDISRRDDADTLQAILNTYGSTIWCLNKDFKYWSWRERKYKYIKPHIGSINWRIYDRLYPQVKKWFTHNPTKDVSNYWYETKYFDCNIPEYFLKMKKVKHWVTHVKVVDELLEQEYAELSALEDRLINHRSWYKMGHKSAKEYQKFRNTTFRRKEKRKIKECIRTGDWDNIDMPICKKQVLWDMY